ncbi:MAG: DUF4233 domain-containing protein [Propionibacteriaceae bacterium]|nr:DUF4233 domain-containing protein [Propionibacteriaceae bacterium]
MRLDPQNPMGRVMLSILVFEAVVCGLAIAGMIQVEAMPAVTSALLGGGAAALALLSAGLLRTPVGYPVGWLTQVVVIGLGFATPMMFAVGGMFGLLWVLVFVLGRRIERSRLSTGGGGEGEATR